MELRPCDVYVSDRTSCVCERECCCAASGFANAVSAESLVAPGSLSPTGKSHSFLGIVAKVQQDLQMRTPNADNFFLRGNDRWIMTAYGSSAWCVREALWAILNSTDKNIT